MKIRNKHEAEKIELQMTPMIDIVFQLLIFFIMTFKIVSLEGDFNIRMPTSAPAQSSTTDDLLPPMTLRLTAGVDGKMTGIRLNERSFENFDQLHQHVLNLVGTDTGPDSALEGAEIELDCDYGLNYEYVVAAITAVTGKVAEDGQVVKLIEKIKFSPPKTPS
jgi:biopolymer transport protein ExbD